MFSWDTFTRMRPGSYFINTAREALVDEAALGRALEAGILAGAALDVLERTPPGEQHRLLGLPNVIVTPHIGGATAETLARGARRAVAAVADLLAGRVPSDVVNPQVLRAGSRPEQDGKQGHMTGRYLLAIDAGTGSCRARAVHRDRRAGRYGAARVDPPRAGRRARRPGLRRARGLAGGRRPAFGTRCAAPARRAATSRRSRPRACARGWSCTTRPAGRSGPARTWTAARPRKPRT